MTERGPRKEVSDAESVIKVQRGSWLTAEWQIAKRNDSFNLGICNERGKWKRLSYTDASSLAVYQGQINRRFKF